MFTVLYTISSNLEKLKSNVYDALDNYYSYFDKSFHITSNIAITTRISSIVMTIF